MSGNDALEESLHFDLFQGDFGEASDVELKNSIVRGRKPYECFICAGDILKGEIHRCAVWVFDGEIKTYRCCNHCCLCMVESMYGDSEIDNEGDPIEARYLIGESIRKESREINSKEANLNWRPHD